MTTKKLLIIAGGIVAGVVLLVVLFVGAILGIVFYSLNKSEAAEVAKTYLRGNEKLKQDVGEVKEFGSFITGNVNVQNSDGDATLNIKVVGERKTVNASVVLTSRSGSKWRVTGASYKDDSGRTVDLMNSYGPAPPE
jgi:CheY-specific phosphatase CheX